LGVLKVLLFYVNYLKDNTLHPFLLPNGEFFGLSKNHTFLEDGFEKPLKGAVNDLIKNLRFIKT